MIDVRAGYAIIAEWLKTWPRLLFMLPTHRIIRLAPGVYVQVSRGMNNKAAAAALRAALNDYAKRIK